MGENAKIVHSGGVIDVSAHFRLLEFSKRVSPQAPSKCTSNPSPEMEIRAPDVEAAKEFSSPKWNHTRGGGGEVAAPFGARRKAAPGFREFLGGLNRAQVFPFQGLD